MDAYMGQIALFSRSRPPPGWMLCDGSVLQIAQFASLYSLVGPYFGGNGFTTFALPDLRDLVVLGAGGTYGYASTGGQVSVVLSQNQANASHTHSFAVTANPATTTDPTGNQLADGRHTFSRAVYATNMYQSGAENVTLAAPTSTDGGGGAGGPHNNLQPFLGLAYFICVQGAYPSHQIGDPR